MIMFLAEETSEQAVANKLAKLAVHACARMAGLLDEGDQGRYLIVIEPSKSKELWILPSD